MNHLLIRNAYLVDGESLKDIKIVNGKIVAIEEFIDDCDVTFRIIDAKRNVVLPTLIESHNHPDKAFLEERKPNVIGTLEETLKTTAELKNKYTYEDVYERAQKVFRWGVRNGTTIMRTIPDVDTFEKTLGVKVFVDLKEKFKEVLDLQNVCFPQVGIVRHPEVYEMMEESIKLGAVVVGGFPYSEDSLEDSKNKWNWFLILL